MTDWPVHGRIDGPIVMIGFGSIGKGTLPLIERHFDYDRTRFVVIDPDDSDRDLLDQRGVRFIHEAVTRENYRDAARRRSSRAGGGQGFCVNLSVDTSSLDIMRLCRELGVALHRHRRRALARLLFRHEPPARRRAPTTPCARRCAQEKRARPRRHRRRSPAAAPIPAWCRGSSSRRCSTSPRTSAIGFAEPDADDRDGWARLMQRPRRQGHPHRRARHPARARSRSRWTSSSTPGRSRASCRRACSRPSSAGARTRNGCPRTAAATTIGCDGGDLPPTARRQHPRPLLVPDARAAIRLPRHPQRVDLDRRLLHRSATATSRRLPADLPLRLSPGERRGAVAARDVRPRRRAAAGATTSSTRTRSSTASTSSACSSTATRRTPTGTARSSRSRRRAQLAPYQNATGLQVTSAVLAGMVWALENPEAGIVEADEMDYRRCLEVQLPYLGPVNGFYTDWTPLTGPRRASSPRTSTTRDPWQFRNVLVR